MEAINVRINDEMTDYINWIINETGLSKSVVLRHIVAQGLRAIEVSDDMKNDIGFGSSFYLLVKKNQTLSDFK